MHDFLHPRRRVGRKLRDRRWVFVQNRDHGFRRSWFAKRPFPRDHLVENCAERKDVRAVVGIPSAHLLRRHIAHGSHHHARFGFLRERNGSTVGRCNGSRDELGQAEVENLGPSILVEEQVLRFQVAMDDASFVRCRQTVRDLHAVVDGLAQRYRPAPEPVAQRFALQ